MTSEISFVLNGERVVCTGVKPKDLLVDYLRSPAVNLTGTKSSCGEGGCGACTVIWSRHDPDGKAVLHSAINSCLRPLASLDGTAITTIEAVSQTQVGVGIEQNMVKFCGSQCGYCSPGFVTTMFSLLQSNSTPTPLQVERQFSGNLCRCTGYISILNAMDGTVTEGVPQMRELLKSDLSKPRFTHLQDGDYHWFSPLTVEQVLTILRERQPHRDDVKLVQGNTSIGIYKDDVDDPHLLIDLSKLSNWRTITKTERGIVLAGGVSIGALSEFLERFLKDDNSNEHSGLRALFEHIDLIAGIQVRNAATVAGSLMLVKKHEFTTRPFPGDLFTVLMTLDARLEIVTMAGTREWIRLREFPPLHDFPESLLIVSIEIPFNRSREVIKTYKVARRARNAHAIVNAGFRCELSLEGRIESLVLIYGGIGPTAIELADTARTVLNDEGATWNQAFLRKILPLISQEIRQRMVKIAENGISEEYRIRLAENLFHKFYFAVAQATGCHIAESDLSALEKLVASPAVGNHAFVIAPYYDPKNGNLTQTFHAPLPLLDKSQILRQVALTSDVIVPTSTALNRTSTILNQISPVKIDAPAQVDGSAKYTHDLAVSPDTLNGFYIYSQRRNATFAYRDGLGGLLRELGKHFPGIHYIHHGDIPKPDPKADVFNPATICNYDPVFSDGTITCYGQPIGMAVGADLGLARRAASFIQARIIYQDGPEPSAASFSEAKARNSLLANPGIAYTGIKQIFRPLKDDDPAKAWIDNPTAVEGSVFVTGVQSTGPQYHFYMEPQGALAIPREDGQIEIFASTQNQSSCQRRIAALLGRPLNSVKVGLTRLGGGFGGKELRQVYVAAAAAVAAYTLKKPVRLLLNRKVDMQMVGSRHPFDGNFAILADRNGKMSRMRVDYASDAGHSFDCSVPVMDLALLCAENAYHVPAFKTTGTVYRTNTQSRTAFRSFGLVQAMLITECAIEKLAHNLGLRSEEVRERNFYPDDVYGTTPPLTPYGAPLPYCRINQVWKDFKQRIDFDERRKAVDEFNSRNKWKKRGIAMIPLKYGISYTLRSSNQGSAYLIAYKDDGSVLLYHGGVEMGQGIHTKMVQVAANTLGIPMSMIRVGSTTTSVVPNVSSTGASTGSDLNGGAVVNACNILQRNLVAFCNDTQADKGKSLKDRKYPDLRDADIDLLAKGALDLPGNWPRVISIAANARQDLSAQYSYASPALGNVVAQADGNYQLDDSGNQVFYYYNYCVAASEVEIDVLTGEFEIRRADLVYDAGDSLNDNIDYGQIEGGFIQGVGCLTTEELLYGEDGRVISDGTWEYKIPCVKTIPREFNVYLLKYVSSGVKTDPRKDPYGINSSKSTGEPPLVLANTVFFAIRNAIAAARKDQGLTDWFDLSAPATVQKIQMACGNVSL